MLTVIQERCVAQATAKRAVALIQTVRKQMKLATETPVHVTARKTMSVRRKVAIATTDVVCLRVTKLLIVLPVTPVIWGVVSLPAILMWSLASVATIKLAQQVRVHSLVGRTVLVQMINPVWITCVGQIVRTTHPVTRLRLVRQVLVCLGVVSLEIVPMDIRAQMVCVSRAVRLTVSVNPNRSAAMDDV
tara:strand:+ start:7660 stop:8226 length:567 start_codon:yes stop_codon:yes gene_type:complete